MKKKLLMPIAALMLLAGCDYNEENFKGLEEMTQPTNVFKKELTMLNADYAAVASNKANVAIAEKAGVSTDLKNVGTNNYFTSIITAEQYFPAFLADKYYTADDGAAVKVTFNKKVSLPEYVNQLNKTTIFTLAATDYQAAWGATSSLNFFTPSKPAANYVPGILAAKVATPVSGQIVCASYNVSDVEPAAMTVAFKEDFETGTTANAELSLANWTNTTVTGTSKWVAKSYSGNKYAQQTAYQHAAGDLDSYLISKEISVEKGMLLTFDALYANYVATGGSITVLVSTNLTDPTTEAGINAAKWDNLTSKFTIPTSATGSGDMVNAGSADLASYVGKKIRIAFRYQGNGTTAATTTTRIDNVTISTPGKNNYLLVNTLYSYSGTAWTPYTTANVLMLSQADFNLMGSKYDNFSSTFNADNYLPAFLKQKYPYAQEGDVKVPVYKFYNSTSKATSIRADEYIFTGGQFVKNDAIETVTDQFVRSEGVWKFDPSTTVTLKKGDAFTKEFLQKVVDGVKASKGDTYIYRDNTEYYYGCSAYYGNVELDPKYWRAMPMYADKTDTEIIATIKEHAEEGGMFVEALKYYYPDANLVEGVEVIYTVNFDVHKVSGPGVYTIQYLVTGKGTFEYIKGSYKEVQ